MKNISIVSFTMTRSDPRVLRQIDALVDVSHLTVYGFGSPPDRKVKFVSFSPFIPSANYSLFSKLIDGALLCLKLYPAYYSRNSKVRAAQEIGLRLDSDIYLANDFESLPFVLNLAPQGSKIFLDAHEFTPDETPPGKWYRPLLQGYLSNWLVKTHIASVSGMMTVSGGIADAYQKKYQVPRPAIVMNTPNFKRITAHPTNPNKIRLIHHGIASRTRGLQILIELMDELDDRFELNLMLMDGDLGYLDKLMAMARLSKRSDDIHFHKPVAYSDIVSYVNKFDLGIIFYPPITTNEILSLPNKFFEYIQARIGVAIGPSPEMSKVVSEFKLGVVGKDFRLSNFSKALNNLSTMEIDNFKINSDQVADFFSWEKNLGTILETLKVED